MVRVALLAAGLTAGGCRGQTAGPPISTPGPTPAAAPLAAPPKAAAGAAAAKSFYAAGRFSRRPSVAAMTELGRRLFFDPQLSVSGKMSCATCHDPSVGYGPPNARSTQLGGVDMKSVGLRAAPGLRYLQALPPFSQHHFDEAVAPTPPMIRRACR